MDFSLIIEKSFAGLLLDGISSAAGERRRFPTDAKRDDSPGRRCASTDGEHLHLQALRSIVQLAPRVAQQVTTGHKDKGLWLRMSALDWDLEEQHLNMGDCAN